LSDDQFMSGAAISKAEVKLSDEQVDLLNHDSEVLSARRAFFASKKQDDRDAEEKAHQHYLRVFRTRLQWVIDNPPPPKVKPKPLIGFAKRA